jgi:hypothetical protein
MADQPRMLKDAPIEFLVPGGTLLYDGGRDGRFPYIFQVDSHPLVHDRDPLSTGRILVCIQDTSPEAMQKLKEFEDSLEVPLGPNDSMAGQGDVSRSFATCQLKVI